MKKTEITAKNPKVNKEATITVSFPETLDEAKKEYGEEVMLSNAFANWRVTVQAGIRRMLEAGKTQAEIQSAFASAKPGVAVSGGRVDPLTAATNKFLSMTEEERAKFIAQLQKAAAVKK